MFPPRVRAALKPAIWQGLNDGFSAKCACVRGQGLGIVATNLNDILLAFLSEEDMIANLKAALPNFHTTTSDAARLIVAGICRGPPGCVVKCDGRRSVTLVVAVSVSVALSRAATVHATLSIPLVSVRCDGSSSSDAFAAAMREYVVLPLASLVDQQSALIEVLQQFVPSDRTIESIASSLTRTPDDAETSSAFLSAPSRVTLMLSEIEISRIAEASAEAAMVPDTGERAGPSAASDGVVSTAEAPQQLYPAPQHVEKDPTAERSKKIRRVFM